MLQKGEGIHDVYLNQYVNKEVTSEFEHYHFDDQPEEWLESAKEKKFDNETGLRFVGPTYFKPKSQKIPAYFHSFMDDPKGEEYMKKKANKDELSFIVVPDSDDPYKGVWITMNDQQNQISSVYVSRDSNNQYSYKENSFVGPLEELVNKFYESMNYKPL